MPRKTISPSNAHSINNKKILTAFLLSNLALNSVLAVGYLDLHQDVWYEVVPFYNTDWYSFQQTSQYPYGHAYVYAYEQLSNGSTGLPYHDEHVNIYELVGGANCIRISGGLNDGGQHELWNGHNYQYFSPGRVDIMRDISSGPSLSAISFTSGTTLSNDYKITVNSGVNIYNGDSSTNATINLVQPLSANTITINNYGGIGNGGGTAIDTSGVALSLTLNQYTGLDHNSNPSGCIGTINCSVLGTQNINIYGGTIKSNIVGGLLPARNNLNFYTNYTIDDHLTTKRFNISNPPTPDDISAISSLTIASGANIDSTNICNFQGTCYIQGGTVAATINNSGTLNISGGTVSGTNTLTNSGTLNLTGGTVSEPIALRGTLNFNGGTMSGAITGTHAANEQINILKDTNLPNDATSFSSAITNVNGITVNPNARFAIQSAITGMNGTFTNNSVVGSWMNSAASLGGSGTLVNSGRFDTNGSFTLANVTNNAGGTLNIRGNTIATSTITNNGFVDFFENGKLTGNVTNNDRFQMSATTNLTGNLTNAAGKTANILFSAHVTGNINNSGNLTIGNTDSAETDVAKITLTAATNNITNNSAGVITMKIRSLIEGAGPINNSGIITVQTGAKISTTGTISNSGTLDLEGGTVTSPINNQASGLLIVGQGSSISSGTSLTNSGTLQANPGGTISIPVTFDAVNGGMINLAGGYITGTITGHGLSTDVINILGDGNSAQSLSQVKDVGNIFINTNNFTINTAMKGVNFNFITRKGSNVIIGGGGDISGNGAISNAGILSVSGGTIGADSPMGNVVNSGTFDVSGTVKVRNFTNGIDQPAGSPLLTAIQTIKIVVNTNGSSTGTFGPDSSGGINPTTPPIQTIAPNPLYTTPSTFLNSAIPNIGSNLSISLTDAGAGSADIVTLMANQGTLNFSAGADFTGITVRGLGSSVVYLKGPISAIKTCIDDHLQFIPTFSQYGVGTVTIAVNDNATGGGDFDDIPSDPFKNSFNVGALNIHSSNMITRHVTNKRGGIDISGGDLSPIAKDQYNITNLAYASDDLNNPTVNTNKITVSGSGTIGNNIKFNNITNNGILIVKDAASTVNATTIFLEKQANYSVDTSGIMTTSGIINADIQLRTNEILNIGGGAINNPITGLDATAASTINVFGNFATSRNITNINNINVTNDSNGIGNFTINNTISGIGTKFTTARGTIVTINNSGHILGNGNITNAGTMIIAKPPAPPQAASTDNVDVIGTLVAPMGVFTNTGAVNVNANNIYVTGFTNNDEKAILNVVGGLLKTVNSNFNNTAGTVNISDGKISSNQVNNSGVINITNTGLITAPIANSGNLNLYAPDSNVGNITNKLNSAPGTINVNAGGVLNNNNLSIAGGTINLNTGGIINIPITFDLQGSTLNLVGGTLNNNVTSSLAIGSGIGVVNVKADYTYGSAHTINNISEFNVASGTTNINSLINNINTSASVARGATMIVNNQGNITGAINTKLTNSGTITLNTGGTISLPIVFGSKGGTLNLSGGYLTTSITGPSQRDPDYTASTINLTSGTNYSDFDQNISNIDIINVQGTSFSINDPITSINTAFNVAQGAAVTINTNGYLSGNGSVNNNGIITLSGGTIGIDTATGKIGKINNSGTINVNNNIYVSGNIINNSGAIATSSGGGAGIFDTAPAVAASPSTSQTNTGIVVNKGGNIYGGVSSVLQNYGIVTLNKGGTVNMPINFGTTDVGVLNLSGGTMNGNIRGGDGVSTSAGTINVNVDTTYTGIGYTIDHVNNINVNNTSIFTIKSNILGVNNIFSTASGATAIIQNGAQIDGSGVITNAGNLYVRNGSLGSITRSFVNVQNTGTLKVDSSGSIYATAINHNGSMTTFGNIHASITFGSNITQLTIGGGSISGIITGYNSDPNAVGNSNVINIIGNFDTSNKINDVGSINVNKGIFNIYNPIDGLSNTFTTAYNTTTNLTNHLTNNGSINGTGVINNIGTMNVSSGGSIGILGTNFNNIYNDGAFNINTGGTVIVNNIYNGILAPSNPDVARGQGLFNVYGNISINVSALSLNIDLNSQSITGALPGTQTTPENTSLTFSAANKNAIVLTGIDDNGGTAQLTAAHGSLSIPSANTANLTSMSGNNSNTLVIAGSLNNLNNALQGLVFTPDANYVGTDAKIEIYLHNNQVVSASDSETNIVIEQPPVGHIPTFTVNGGTLQTNVLDNISNFTINGGTDNLGAVTNHAANAVLNITGGTVTATSVTNTLGAINISGGDLSSASAANRSPLTNAAVQTITISGTGTLGFNQAFGDITNNGIVQSIGTNLATGNNITIGKFTNNAIGAELKISGGTVVAGNISNTLGAINISGGDLSSASAVTPSTLTNAAGQTITVSGTGTIGFNQAFGDVTNNGILKSTGTNLASGNNITVGNFTNNATGAELNISGGKVVASNISNTLGTINISGGDLSSASSANPSTLTNAAGQVMTIYGPGTIGAIKTLGIFNNNGLFNVIGGNISASTLSNNGIVNMVQPATISNGNYTVTSSGTHIVDIDVSNNPATLNLANGTATLQANSTIYVRYNGDVLVPNNHVYNVITSNNRPNTPGLDASNNITGVNIAGSTDLVYYTPQQSGNNIQVVSHRKLIEDVVDNVGNYTANPAATVLDSLINSGVVTGDLRTALARLDGLGTDQEVSDAVNQLLPETSITSDIGFIAPSMTFSTITERAELIARSPIENQTGYAYGDASVNNSFWVKGFGGNIQQKQKVTTAGYTASTAGVAFGLDNQLLENTWVGLGFSTVNTHINSKDVSAKKTTVVTQQATLYSSYSPENYYIDSLLAMAFNSYKLQRNIVYNNLNYRSQAAYNAIQPAAKIAAGYIYNVNPVFKIIPNLSLQYSLLRQSTYTEYGAGNLSLRDVTSPILTQLEGGAGVKFSFLQEQDEQIYKPELHFMVLHDFKSTAQTTTAQFIGGGGTFKITGTQPNKTSYTAGLGFTAVHQDQFNFTLRYDFKYRNKFIGHSGYLAVRYMF